MFLCIKFCFHVLRTVFFGGGGYVNITGPFHSIIYIIIVMKMFFKTVQRFAVFKSI